MKRIAAIIVTLAVYPAMSSAAEEAAASGVTVSPTGTATAQVSAPAQKAVGRIYVMSGNVMVGQGSRVNTSGPIYSGMLVKTGEKSSALLQFDDGQVVTMQSRTSFQVREYHYDTKQVEKSKIDFAFYEGGVRLATGLIGQKKRLAFSLVTPSATIRGDVAKFLVVKADNLIYSKVLDGNIRITNSGGTASFKAGEAPVVRSSLILASEFYTTAPRGIFDELLSIPVTPPFVAEPIPVPAPAPEPAPAPVPAPSPETGSAPSPGSAAAPAPAPVPVPSPEPMSAPSPELVPAPASETAPAPSAEPAPFSASVLVPAQAAPNCTCTCTYSGK